MTGITGGMVTDLLAQANSLLLAFWPAILVCIGIPLGFYVGKKVIGLFPKK